MFEIQEDLATNMICGLMIADSATNAFLKNVSLNVNIQETVRRAKNVLMTIVPFHQVINHLCDFLLNLA